MLEKLLQKSSTNLANIFPFDLNKEKHVILDLSVENQELFQVDLSSVAGLQQYIAKKLQQVNARYAIGGYGEDRLIYRKSEHFGKGENVRSIHLGTDIWITEYRSISAILEGRIHSCKNNDNYGDYGPTIILEHCLDGTTFYTLYGHLSKKSLENKKAGQIIQKGEVFAELGNQYENGNWPPHLHFQIIADMNGCVGDFPGVSSQADKAKYLQICPNPNLLLKIN